MNQNVKIAEIARVAEQVVYDPDTGIFRSRVTKRGWPAGRRVGGKDAKGYVVIKNNDFVVKAHRLAWFIVHGELPALVDHINGDPADNRICNLRPATKSLNGHNTSKRQTGVSGLAGVRRVTGSDKWVAVITVAGQRKSLGCFDTPQQAHARYLREKSAACQEATHAC